MNNIEALLKPRSIAVIGASAQEGKIGNIILSQLAQTNFKVYPVNPKAGHACGLRVYASIEELPEVPDLAVLAVPAEPTLTAARACVQMGVKAIIAIASGFGETGKEGKMLENELADIIHGTGTRLLGPNTLGVLDPASGLDTNFLPPQRIRKPAKGKIAFLSQSGSAAIGELDAASMCGAAISAFVGFGNRLDIDENELLDYFANDEETSVIALYLESFADAGAFLQRCRRIVPHKPVVLLKAGRSEAGAKAVQLHTGSLAGSDRVTDGTLRQSGIIRAYEPQQLFDYARALAYGKTSAGRRVAVLTNGGGWGIVASDYIESQQNGIGAKLAALSVETQQKLASIALPFAALRNPIDLTASLDNQMCNAALEILQEDAGVDIILFVTGYQPPAVDESLTAIIQHWALHGEKPLVPVLIGSDVAMEAMQTLNRAGVPAYPSIWRGVQALEVIARRSDALLKFQKPAAEETPLPVITSNLTPGKPVSEAYIKQALSEIGIPVPRFKLLPWEGKPDSQGLKYPLVVKVNSASILHKTEKMGVVLNISDKKALATEVEQMRQRFPCEEILIEEMQSSGVEMIVGLVDDPTFGLAIMVGLGGVKAELYQDVVFRKLPIDEDDADEMLRELKGHAILEGFRGIQADRKTLVKVLLSLSQFAQQYDGKIQQMDLNPLIVQPEGVVAVDAKLLWKPA